MKCNARRRSVCNQCAIATLFNVHIQAHYNTCVFTLLGGNRTWVSVQPKMQFMKEVRISSRLYRVFTNDSRSYRIPLRTVSDLTINSGFLKTQHSGTFKPTQQNDLGSITCHRQEILKLATLSIIVRTMGNQSDLRRRDHNLHFKHIFTS